MKLRIRRRPPNGRKARRASSVRSSAWPRRAASPRRISTSSGPTSKSVTRCSSPYWRRWRGRLEPAAISKSLLETECRQREQLVPPTVLAITGRANNVPLRCSADALVALTLALEDGTAYAGDLRANCACTRTPTSANSWNSRCRTTCRSDTTRSTCRSAACSVAPRSSSPRPASNCPKRCVSGSVGGWMTQMYSVRSADSWVSATTAT